MYFNVMGVISIKIYYMFTIYIKLKFWLFIFWCLEGDVLSKLHQSKINSFYSKTKTLRRYILKLSLNSQFFGINFESDFDLKVQSTPSIPLQILLSVRTKKKFKLQTTYSLHWNKLRTNHPKQAFHWYKCSACKQIDDQCEEIKPQYFWVMKTTI